MLKHPTQNSLGDHTFSIVDENTGKRADAPTCCVPPSLERVGYGSGLNRKRLLTQAITAAHLLHPLSDFSRFF